MTPIPTPSLLPHEELKALRKSSGLSRAAWLRCLGIKDATLHVYESRCGRPGPALLARARKVSAEGAALVSRLSWD